MSAKHGTQEIKILSAMIGRNDNENILDPGLDKRVDWIKNHLPIIDREKLFAGRCREWQQSCARASGKDDTFHNDYKLQIVYKYTNHLSFSIRIYFTFSEVKLASIPNFFPVALRYPFT